MYSSLCRVDNNRFFQEEITCDMKKKWRISIISNVDNEKVSRKRRKASPAARAINFALTRQSLMKRFIPIFLKLKQNHRGCCVAK